MPDPDQVDPEAIRELLKQAAATAYTRPALHAFAAELAADDAVIAAALFKAVDQRDAKGFSQLYLAALMAGRPVPATVLEIGGSLLPDAMLLAYTAMRLEGDVAQALAAAVRAGRMGSEREALAIATGWLDYERREIPAPPDFLALTRKHCRQVARAPHPALEAVMLVAAKLSGDPLCASILQLDEHEPAVVGRLLRDLRHNQRGSSWDNTIPSSPVAGVALGHGLTVKRAVPKTRRNDPCPCGSGKKFKHCCAGKTTTSDQYEAGGVTIAEARAHPELLLSPDRIMEMRPHELYAINPAQLLPPLGGDVAARLVLYREIPRAIEVLKAVGPAAVTPRAIEDIAEGFFEAENADALRWLRDWAPDLVELSFDQEILLATPSERLLMLQEKARETVDAERSGDPAAAAAYCEIGYAALATDPALGLLIARGVLPVCHPLDQETLVMSIDDARDRLFLDDDDPAHDILGISDRTMMARFRHAFELEEVREENATRVSQRDAEIDRLKSRIDDMQQSLAQHESAMRQQRQASDARGSADPAADERESPELRELRDDLRRLKDNLKVEHEERNRALRDLRATKEQLRRAARQQAERPASDPSAGHQAEGGEDEAIAIDWEGQALRIPEFSGKFREALRNRPRQTAAAAMAAVGRLAAGDPSIWRTVRALKMRPGTLRVRIAGDYRLLFEPGQDDSLRVIDLILRRDLDRWLASAGR